MPLKNTPYTYGSAAKLLHWAMFVLIVCLIAVGFVMTDMENSPDKFKIYGLHKSIGMTILFLAVCRVIWKLKNISPTLPDTLDVWQKRAARAGHVALYVLMFAMPLTGWAMSSASGFPVSVFGWFVLPSLVGADKELASVFKEAHEIIAYLLIIMILLHTTAALLHHFYYKDNVLRSMLFSIRARRHD